MTEANKFNNSDGQFNKENKSTRPCRVCGCTNVTIKVWESSCGGYEDEKYTCPDCGHTWWVDGCDA